MKKRILSEGNVRRMMKLANIGTLTESFIEETEELEENGEGVYVDESLYEQEEDELGDMGDEEIDMDPGDPADPDEDEPMAAEGPVDADDLSDFLEFINDKVDEYAEMNDIDLDVEFEEEGEEDLGGPMGEPGDEDLGDMPPEEEEAGPMMENLRREIEGSLHAAGFYMEEEIETGLINEVTRRVAHRLLMARARKG